MIAIPARLAIVLAIVPLVLAAWVLVCLLRENGVRPLREAAKFLPRGVLGCLRRIRTGG